MKLGAAEKSAEENEKLKQQAVTYIQYDDLQDFAGDHSFNSDR